MSQSTAVRAATRPATRHAARPVVPPPRLRVVTAPAQYRSRAGLVFACLALLAAGLVGLLLLNVSLERGAYVLGAQQTRAAKLQEQRQALQEQLAALQAPQALAEQAAKLGMVRNPNAAFIGADTGTISGVPKPAVKPRAPSVTATTPATGSTSSPSATPTARPSASASHKTAKASPAPTPTSAPGKP